MLPIAMAAFDQAYREQVEKEGAEGGEEWRIAGVEEGYMLGQY